MIRPYTPHKEVDAVLARLGEDYYLDDIYNLQEDEEDVANDDPDPKCDDGEVFAWLEEHLDEHTAFADATEAVASGSGTQPQSSMTVRLYLQPQRKPKKFTSWKLSCRR